MNVGLKDKAAVACTDNNLQPDPPLCEFIQGEVLYQM